VAAAGPWLGGYARDHLGGFAPAFWLFAGLAVAVMAAVALMRPPSRRPVAPSVAAP
jgi:cyanate permease